jgi:hypothetical protein
MSLDDQKQSLLRAVTCVRSAETLLMQAGRDTADPAVLAKIDEEYDRLDSFLSQLLHCIAIIDDRIFADTAVTLKNEAQLLQASEDRFKAIGIGVNTAAQIVGFITEALSLVAKI